MTASRPVLFNIDDLQRIKEHTLHDRLKHVAPAEAIVEQEQQRFLKEWRRRHNGPAITRLIQQSDALREAIVKPLLEDLNGLPAEKRERIERDFRLFQNRLLHAPISALDKGGHEGSHTLLEALRKLFRLEE